jgi:glc operon protein GlcG
MTRLKLATVLLIGVATSMTSFGQDSLDSKLISRTALSLAAAKDIASAAEAEALKNNWNVSIAIVDESGRLLYFQRMDDTTNASVEIAIAKAQHAANYRRDTKFHEDALDNGKNVVLALPDGMPLEGGLRLIANDKIIGGIGVSGVRSIEDAQIARAGAGLLTR